MKLVVQTDGLDIDIAIQKHLAAKGLVAVDRSLMKEIASVSSLTKWNIVYNTATDSYHWR